MPNRNLFEARFAQHFRAPVPRPTSCPGLHHPVPATHSCSASSISCRAVERLGGQDCSPGGLRHGCFASREGIRDRRKSNHFMVNYGGSLGAGRCNRERLWRLADVVAIPPHHIGDEGDDARCPPSVGLPPFLFTGSASILGRKGSPTQPPASIRKVSLAVATNRIGDSSETGAAARLSGQGLPKFAAYRRSGSGTKVSLGYLPGFAALSRRHPLVASGQ